MKKILSLVMTLAAAATLHAQGTFAPATWANSSGGAVVDCTTSGTGPGSHNYAFGSVYQAQYYIGAAGITGSGTSVTANPATGGDNTVIAGMTAVGPQAGFLGSSGTDVNGGAGFFEANANQPITTSFAGGATVSLMLYAWKGGSSSTLANATVAGHSAVYQFVLGGAGNPASQPTSWSGAGEPTMANFGIATVGPEPATMALGLMGVGALFIRRRK
jgi:MYXO-CTERM domain-containing protein